MIAAFPRGDSQDVKVCRHLQVGRLRECFGFDSIRQSVLVWKEVQSGNPIVSPGKNALHPPGFSLCS